MPHVSAACLAFAPIGHLRTIVTPAVAPCAPTNGEHVPSSPPELARKISAKVLPKLPHPDRHAWAEATSVVAASELAPSVGYVPLSQLQFVDSNRVQLSYLRPTVIPIQGLWSP